MLGVSDNDISEEKLVQSLKKGDEKAFNVIFHQWFPTLFQYSVQMLKSEIDAEDVVQEAFIRLWQHRDRITSETTVKSILFVITRNLLLTKLKRKLNTPVFEDYLLYLNKIGRYDNSMLEYKQFCEYLDSIVMELPPHQQRVVRMSKFQQMTNKEIASALEINEQSVKNNLSLGLKYIRNRLTVPLIIFMESLILKFF